MSSNGQAYILGDRAGSLAHYPHARRAGPYIYVSGISSRQREPGVWELDIRAQTKAIFENIKVILQEAGASLEHLVDLTVFLIDMADYDGFNEVIKRIDYLTSSNSSLQSYFDAETGPTRTTVAVKQLPCKPPNRLLIEIKAVALAP
ncbi:Endoribonuclease L-PSP/chorismate mutase-like protein [Syncephalis plumigaleata]|nr:Endoribonuclease L-PSP/chorismate mutase-like protein [Syncephalis plumigaleata]